MPKPIKQLPRSVFVTEHSDSARTPLPFKLASTRKCHLQSKGQGDVLTREKLNTDTMTRTALKNAIIKSFDDYIKDCKNWGLEHTLQYLEKSLINFDEKDYPFIKQEVINKAIDNSSKISTEAVEIFQRQKNKIEQNRVYYRMDKNVRKIETSISSVHVGEVKRRAEISNQANKRNRVYLNRIFRMHPDYLGSNFKYMIKFIVAINTHFA
ncbi:hypothetical protein Glove_355g95 [Diversispora epigaea]|uniref:Uncharacterized protein n=1 Tax=Diversispora epigaea TaxID=1348612 RepID=A0A397HE10_9GLOM|nr:hypothetical protein Glove_355g95 [Diversispora epigaea]